MPNETKPKTPISQNTNANKCSLLLQQKFKKMSMIKTSFLIVFLVKFSCVSNFCTLILQKITNEDKKLRSTNLKGHNLSFLCWQKN
jgi:hypothetical protein